MPKREIDPNSAFLAHDTPISGLIAQAVAVPKVPTDISLDVGEGGGKIVVQASTLRLHGEALEIDRNYADLAVASDMVGVERQPRRALVHDEDGSLVINYGNDYRGGVIINSARVRVRTIDTADLPVVASVGELLVTAVFGARIKMPPVAFEKSSGDDDVAASVGGTPDAGPVDEPDAEPVGESAGQASETPGVDSQLSRAMGTSAADSLRREVDLWLCVRGSTDSNSPAVWKRVQLAD